MSHAVRFQQVELSEVQVEAANQISLEEIDARENPLSDGVIWCCIVNVAF